MARIDDDDAIQVAAMVRKGIKWAITVVLGIIALFLVFGSWFIVSPGDVAIKTRMGKLIDSYDSGPHFKLPLIDSIDKFTIRIQRSDIKTQAFTADQQTMSVVMAVNHRVEKGTILSVYQNLGDDYMNTIVDPKIQEIFKAIAAKYTADTIVANRASMVAELNSVAKATLLEKQIIVTDIDVVDLDFTPEYLKAVEQKQIAEQDSKKAQRLVEKATMEAQQVIATAKGNAEALRLQKEQITPMMLEKMRLDITLEAVKHWKGDVPYYMGANTPIPFIDSAISSKSLAK